MSKPSKDPLRIEAALKALELAIAAGQEFPDACWNIASNRNVDYEALADAYDEACQHRRDRRDGYTD